MMTWRWVAPVLGKLRRCARSTIGSTEPRRFMTPRRYGGACGRAVAGVQPRISRTDMMSTQNSCVPTRKAMNSFATVADALDMTLTRCGQNLCGSERAAAAIRDDRIDVENERDPAVSENRGGGDSRHVAIVGFEALDNDLTLIVDGVDEKRATGADLGLDDERDACKRICGIRAATELPANVDQRREAAAIGDDARFDAEPMHVALFRSQRLDDRRQRHDEGLVGDADDHAVEHRERERQAHGEGRAEARTGRNRNAAAERLNRALDDVHPNATPGNTGHRRIGREPWEKQEVVKVAVRELRIGLDQVLLDRLRADLRPVDSAAIVRHFDDDAPR